MIKRDSLPTSWLGSDMEPDLAVLAVKRVLRTVHNWPTDKREKLRPIVQEFAEQLDPPEEIL